MLVNASIALGVGKREIEENYSYDEIVTMLDIYAYANADEKEKKRYAGWAIKYKILNGVPVSKEEARGHSLFG